MDECVKNDRVSESQGSRNSGTGDNVIALETNDPYAYLERNDFTSEKFKIEIRGLPKFYGIGQLRKLLNEKLQLGSNKVKPLKPGSYWAYVCFRSEEDRTQALRVLNGYKWKGSELKAHIAKPSPDPLVKKRKEQIEESEEGPRTKQQRLVGKSYEEQIRESTSPYWNLSYTEQLARKEAAMREVLLQLGREIHKLSPQLHGWLRKQRDIHGGLPCQLLPIRPSPVLNGYRNKCEFTVGINEETSEPTVGFRVGSYMEGSSGVAPVDCLDIVPDRMKEVAKAFEVLVRQSPLPVFNPETHTGVWRQLTARLSGSGQLLLVAGVHPQGLSPEQLQQLRQELTQHFSSGPGQACRLHGLFLQLIQKREAGVEAPPLEHLMGETSIQEAVCGVTFQVSPEAFFQVNTAAAEVLYQAVAELAAVSPTTTLLDVCCGTGSIGLSLAKHCGQVMGVEISKKAVDDAKKNAIMNNITNCEFFAGSAEELLSAMIQRAAHDDIVAVVDPPRAGLHQRAMTHLRNARKLDKLVYVSCDPKAALNNFVLLIRQVSKAYHRPPLIPVCAVPVDLFPHTPHCELAIYFERLKTETEVPRKEKSTE